MSNFELYWALGCDLEAWNLEKTTTTTSTTTTTTTSTTTTTTTSTTTSTTTTTTTTTSTTKRLSNYPCIVDDPSVQYCYTLPEQYASFDSHDNNDDYYYVDTDFNSGNTIRFSKVCSDDWYYPGAYYEDQGSKSQFQFFESSWNFRKHDFCTLYY